MGNVRLLLPSRQEVCNTEGLIGRVEIVTAFVREHGLRVVEEQQGDLVSNDGEQQPGRGRRRGSTNWTRDRFWRGYSRATQGMARPYKRTHLAARIGLVYATFSNYFERWGPPPGSAAPGE